MIEFILDFLGMLIRPIAYGIVEVSLEIGFFFYTILGSRQSKEDYSPGKKLLIATLGALIFMSALLVIALAVLK